ncbi:unnamed protein product [Auanema sp. JU1783]|nr:unnamed protein product [Auanema sp. JU1783]
MYRMKNKQYSSKYSRYDVPGYEAETDSSEEDNDSDSGDSEPCIRPTLKSSRVVDRRYRDHRSLRPTLGVAARNRLRSQPIDAYSSTTYSSSNLETTTETNETDPSDLYTPIPYNRSRRSPARHLLMDEDISPVRPEHQFVAPSVPSLIKRNFQPTLTSTTTSIHKIFPIPKTNPRLGGGMVCSTPRSSSSGRGPFFSLTTSYAQALNMEKQRPKSYYGTEADTSSFWDNTRAASLRSIPETVNSGYYRPENFGLHAAYAKNRNTKGIMFLTMTMSGNMLTVAIHNAVYFLESGPSVCSFVQAELRTREKEDRHEHRKRHYHHDRNDRRERNEHSQQSNKEKQCFRTDLVPSTNKPEFKTVFQFQLSTHRRASLFICVWAMSAEHAGFNINKKKMLGCMTFPISRLLAKARKCSATCFDDENMSMEEVVVNDGGFFLLDDKDGQRTNMPQHKINKAEFYDDPALSGSCALTTASYSSSNLTSQMPMEEFAKASRAFGSSLLPGGYSSADDVRVHDYTSASSSSNSRDASEFGYHGQHRATLPCVLNAPSITTTSDTTTSEHDVFGGAPSKPDYHYLYVDNNENDSEHKLDVKTKDVGVRRAASFTFSPRGAAEKHNKRPVQVKLKEEEKEKRKLRGPISKTISYIRSKMDTALSTTSLYASKEEIRQWETCFEALLNHKHGCSLFRQFLKKEFSDENVDFWQDCEEFRKMKEGKKATTQRAHEIYREYVAEQAPKEVNLDSDTRAATKAALESGCKTDTFLLAQSRIEQLMEKDSYRRFLKDSLYLDLLKSIENNEIEGSNA